MDDLPAVFLVSFVAAFAVGAVIVAGAESSLWIGQLMEAFSEVKH